MRKIILIILICLLPLKAFAWNSFGHQLVATIAYDNLRPEVKRKVNILTDAMNQVYPKTTFIVASSWPDQIKYQDVKEYDAWHYYNKPYSNDGSSLIPIEQQNVIWAIKQSLLTLESNKSIRYQKGMFLRFLTHFVGDIHQPMHCIEYISRKFPGGDNGGNLYPIKFKKTHNLHTLWDTGIGMFWPDTPKLASRKQRWAYSIKRKRAIRKMASQIEKQYPQSDFKRKLNRMQPGGWAFESYSLAKNFAYTLGLHQHPNSAYVKKGREIVKRRIAVAGYRLAKLLNQLFS